MQTFLPYEDFVRSALVLDSPRLGKQRVETLQVLRALVFPTYGWQTHPAVEMWRGYAPALVRYGLDMVGAWTDRGHADTTAAQMREFAPEVASLSRSELGAAGMLPSWLGREDVHRSHRSNLVRKAPPIYGPHFPDVSDELPYVWPGADPEPPPSSAREIAGSVWVVRARDDAELRSWLADGLVGLRTVSRRGTASPKWRRQLDEFAAEVGPGSRIAVLAGSGGTLPVGSVTSGLRRGAEDDGPSFLSRRVAFDGQLSRSDVSYPALLQDPRFFFAVPLAPVPLTAP